MHMIFMYVLSFGVKCNVVTGAENVCLLWIQLSVFVLDLFYSLSAYQMDEHYQWFCRLLFLSLTVVSWAKSRIVRHRAFLSITPLRAKAPNLGLSRKETPSLPADVFILEWSSCEAANWWLRHEGIKPACGQLWSTCQRSGDPLAGGQVTHLPEVRITSAESRQSELRSLIASAESLRSELRSVWKDWLFFLSCRFLTVPRSFCPYHGVREHF